MSYSKFLDFDYNTRDLTIASSLIILCLLFIGSATGIDVFTVSGGNSSLSTQDYEVYTTNVTEVTTTSLELSGNLTGISDLDDPLDVWFNISVSGQNNWSIVDAGMIDSAGNFSAVARDLSPGTEYDYEAYTKDYSGGLLNDSTMTSKTISGGQVSFTTDDYSIDTTGADGVGDRSINMTGDAIGLSDLQDPIEVWFEYRKSGGSWKTADAGTIDSAGTFNRIITGLEPGADYEFEAYTNHRSGGIDSVTTSTYDITTEGSLGGSNSIRFEGYLGNVSSFTTEIDDQIGLSFQYRKNGTSTWNTVNAGSRSIDGFFAKRVEGLETNTVYEYRARSEDGFIGDIKERSTVGIFTAEGGVVTFVTGPAFNVSIDNINTPLFGGNEVKVDAMVQNTGAEGVATVDLNIPGLGSDTADLNLSSGETKIKTFNVSTTSSDTGEYTANISSASDYDTQAFNVSELRPPIDPQPEDNTNPVGLDWDLSAVANGTGSFDRGINFYVKNNSNNLSAGSGLASPDERVNVSLSSLDLDTGTTYEWFAESEYSGITETSQDWNFTTVERPEVLSIEPSDGSGAIDENPTLNVTVNGSSEIKVEFYNDAGGEMFHSETVSPSGTASYDLSGYGDLGEGLTEYWYVSLESMGVEWNNSENPYRFSISDVSEVNYDTVKLQNNDNLNPGSVNSLDVVGPSKLEFEASNPQGATMDVGLNISNSTTSKQIIRSNIGNNSVATFDVQSSTAQNIIEANSDYTIHTFYQEGTTKYASSDFVSSDYSISTNVAELNWTDASPSRTEEFRIYFNENDQAFNTFSQVGSINADSTDMEAGVANRGLDSDGSQDCYAVRAWAPVGGLSDYSTTDGHCIGGGEP